MHDSDAARPPSGATRIGIDTGGTFTDVAVRDETSGELHVHKLPSTPEDPAVAVLRGLAAVRQGRAVDVVHGTTVGLNAVLTGRVARTAFVTNEGFEDLIEIGRQERTSLYDLHAARPELPVPRSRRFAVRGRRTANGEREGRPTVAELDQLRRKLARAHVEAVAIGLLHSYAHPGDEHEVARRLAGLGVPITCSADLLPIHGEYERFAAAILNAAISPVMGSYLARLDRGIGRGSLRLMRSSGGAMPTAEAHRYPARAVFSGPAGGVVATQRLARAHRLHTVAALDMGGTSTDVSLVAADGQRATASAGGSSGRPLAGLPLAVPGVDVHTIGCGGGSIARVDRGGALVVGPESAGADPGPACYGRGDEPTVTDAHMVLGHMGADTLLAGEFPVDPQLSLRAVARLATRLGCQPRRAAEGILEIAEVAMMRALLVITVQRNIDPGQVPLVAFGGAGGLHAAGLLRRLSMPRALVPRDPGAFSAVGLALASDSHEEVVPVLRTLHRLGQNGLRRLTRQLAARARRGLATPAPATVEAHLRFAGQGQGLWVAVGPELEASFRGAHQTLFGFCPDDGEVELVELRARAEGPHRDLPAPRRRPGSRAAPQPRQHRRPPVRGTRWPVFARSDLVPGDRLTGPCLIEELTGAVVVPRGFECGAVRDALEITDTAAR